MKLFICLILNQQRVWFKRKLIHAAKNVFCTRTIKYTYKKTKSIKEAFEKKKNRIKKCPQKASGMLNK